MENQLIKVITDSKVEQSTALTLQNAFLPFYDNLLTWSEKAKTLVVTNASQTREMKMAREGRLALRDIRVAANKKRIVLKEDSTRYGKAVQSVYNLIDDLCTPAEKHLEEQEKFVEIQEEKRKAELKAIRSAELLPYAEFLTPSLFAELGEYTEEEYSVILNKSKEALENKIAAEAQAELDRIAKEKEKVERQGKMFELGFKWDGCDFVYKGQSYAREILNFSAEGFETILTEAKAKKEEIDLRLKEQLDAENKQMLSMLADLEGHTPIKTTVSTEKIGNAVETIITLPNSVKIEVAPVYRAPEIIEIKHPFHCFLCGAKLSEIGLGGLECDDCLTVFNPFLDEDGNQCLASQK